MNKVPFGLCERCYGKYTREPSDPVELGDDGMPWHTGPDVGRYVELNRTWAIKWMKTLDEKSLLMNALKVFIKSLDGDLDGLLIAKLNAQSVLKTMEGE